MTLYIAEIGNNHNGNPEIAIELVREALDAGADGVKLPLLRAHLLVNKDMMPPKHANDGKTWRERLQRLELPFAVLAQAREICTKRNKIFVCTPLHESLVEPAAELGHLIKIASGDLTHEPILEKARRYAEDRVILSTGMTSTGEVAKAVRIARPQYLLHCVSLYPTPYKLANLGRIRHLKSVYPNISIGYSDHTEGYLACLGAVALGAEMIEKHFKGHIDGIGGDFGHSLSSGQFARMITDCSIINQLSASHTLAQHDWTMRKFMRRGKNGLRGSYRGEIE